MVFGSSALGVVVYAGASTQQGRSLAGVRPTMTVARTGPNAVVPLTQRVVLDMNDD